MFGHQPTGAVEGVEISAVVHEGLTVTYNGRPASLAVIDEFGNVVAFGPKVAREAEAVALNCYRAMLHGKGHLRVRRGVPNDPLLERRDPLDRTSHSGHELVVLDEEVRLPIDDDDASADR